jgi:Flp pilus assembly pilin Flp
MRILIQKSFRRLLGQSGQSLVEYALVLALVSIVAATLLLRIGTSTNKKLTTVNHKIQ